MRGIAATNVQMIKQSQCSQRFDGELNTAIPALFADFFKSYVAQLLFTSLTFAKGVMS